MISQSKFKALQEAILADKAYDAEKMPDGSWKTKCNFGLIAQAEEFGITCFRGLMADDIVNLANMGLDFEKVSGAAAAEHAMAGGFGFGGKTGKQLKEAHGHIAVVAPQACSESGSLEKMVPYLCNIGLPPNRIKLSSACFPVAKGECDYFIYVGDKE